MTRTVDESQHHPTPPSEALGTAESVADVGGITVTVNGERRMLARGLRVAALVRLLGLHGGGIAVALDGRVVPRSEWESTSVADGAEVDVVTAMQGG